MKIIYYLNKFVFIITLVLYLTLVYGLFAQIILGVIQVLSAIILFSYWKKFDRSIKNKVLYYWLAITIYGILWLFNWEFLNNWSLIIFVIILFPMAIASYFFYILNSIKHI